ncbi:MAG: MCE family protein [Nitrospirae bacterium]|nr:MCE family protein [Nitrospirota bacterium]
MSKQANKTLIGSFVVGAVVLIIAGVLIFGSGRLFTKMEKHVLYFKGSVKGLNIGSPVMFRGVKIGSVTDILLQFNSEDLSMRIPVIIDIEPEKFISQDNVREMGKGYIDQLITKGLRAQLQMQSMVTGQLMINLDFYPDKPATLAGIKGEYPEIPTISSNLEELTIEKIVNSPELIGSVGSFDQALKDIHSLLANIDKQFTPLANSVINTSVAAQSALGQFEKTIAMEEGAPADLAAELKDTLSATRDAMEAVKSITAKDSESVYELNNALKELSAAARSIRFMADYIEQHPEALIRGKKDTGGE